MNAIQVFTMQQCPNCPTAKRICAEVADELNLNYAELDMEEHMVEALHLQIASVPTIVYNDKVLFRSEVPDKQVIVDAIKKNGVVNGE